MRRVCLYCHATPDRRDSPWYNLAVNYETREGSTRHLLVAFILPSSSLLEACFMPAEAFACRESQ
jgi:hypothetical protein